MKVCFACVIISTDMFTIIDFKPGMDYMDWEALGHEFNENKPRFEALEREATFALEDCLKSGNVKYHVLLSRIKTYDSFIDKLKREQADNPGKQVEPFKDIHQDIVGLRVVCLFLSDIATISGLIRSSFEILHEDNKIEAEQHSSFGYMSVHFNVELMKSCAGPRYDGIKGMPFEIQLRTISMDAWAAASRYLDYKSEQAIPKELKRAFHALSGLFYVADTQFEMLYEASQKSRDNMTELFNKPETDWINQTVDLDSLTAYFQKKFADRRHSDPNKVSELVNELLSNGYNTIGMVNEAIETAKPAFFRREEVLPEEALVGGTFFTDVGVVRTSLAYVDEDFRRFRGDITPLAEAEEYRKYLSQ